MNIGAAARASGVSAKMIRYYEQTGLIPPAGRNAANYRDYAERDVARLRFIHRARQLGFSIADIGELLQKWQSPQRDNAEVRALTSRHVAALRQRVDEIQAMIRTLEGLALSCEHNGPEHCVILDALVGEGDELASGSHCDFHHFGQPEGEG